MVPKIEKAIYLMTGIFQRPGVLSYPRYLSVFCFYLAIRKFAPEHMHRIVQVLKSCNIKFKRARKTKNKEHCFYLSIAMVQSSPVASTPWLDNGFKMLLFSSPWICLIHVSPFWVRIQIKNMFSRIKIRVQCLR